jgi:hypothetical protein
MEEHMAKPDLKQPQALTPGQPDVTDELRRRDQPLPDAPATVPHPGEEVEPGGSQPPEDGGVPQHPIHDSDVEDLGPQDYEELTDEVAKTGIKTETPRDR